jgi:hypothetical protein
MKRYATLDVRFQEILAFLLDNAQFLAARQGRFNLGESFQTYIRERLDGPKNLSRCGEEFNPASPIVTQSQHTLTELSRLKENKNRMNIFA